MIPVIFVCVFGALALYYVSKPLFGSERSEVETGPNEAMVRKLRALEAILDLEADRASGKLSEDDFETFKEIYERDALVAMRELDVDAQTVGDDDIESEIAAARAELR